MLKNSRFVVVVLLVLVAAVCIFHPVDPVGYCASEHRIIPGSEFQRATFNILKTQRKLVLSVEELGGVTRHNIKPYDEKYSRWAKSFDGNNCCDVERHASFFQRLTGFQEVVVRVNPRAPEPYDDWLTFKYDVCGNLRSSDAGVPSAELHNVKITDKELQDDSNDF
ncbi:hypothetical protein [Pseudomonas bohemica]|uniref:hypothetical protein n=1 Tax=Pseudomonas bohemica TaxID=2044872 RepID=UPI0018FEB11F|nr:hypothetical protein [Pseudomonas bohemica]